MIKNLIEFGGKIFKKNVRYNRGHMESHTVFLHTHDQKHLQNTIFFFWL